MDELDSKEEYVPTGACSAAHDCRRCKLQSTDWLADIPGGYADSDFVEVQFKNTRKGYYRNCTNLPLIIGDLVAVEAVPGHDIGTVSMTGALVELRMKRARIPMDSPDIKRVFRKAKPADIEKYDEARAREDETMIRARKIAEDLKLNMKIGDVEFQGDGNKAIFYYIADERVDFRQLIKVLADTFKVRIEMKQIGARQEAGRIGGIGPCGRPLCCSLWMSNFVSVSTSAARHQDISLNPQKLAGQCAKLKCCLNFEVDAYVEANKNMPRKEVRLETADNTYYHFKSDIFGKTVTYSTDKNLAANLVTITAERAFEVIAMNKAGEKPLSLLPQEEMPKPQKSAFGDILDDGDLTRFDKKKKRKKKGPASQAKKESQEPKEAKENNGGKENNGAPAPRNRNERRPPKASKDGANAPKDGANAPKGPANAPKDGANAPKDNRPKQQRPPKPKKQRPPKQANDTSNEKQD